MRAAAVWPLMLVSLLVGGLAAVEADSPLIGSWRLAEMQVVSDDDKDLPDLQQLWPAVDLELVIAADGTWEVTSADSASVQVSRWQLADDGSLRVDDASGLRAWHPWRVESDGRLWLGIVGTPAWTVWTPAVRQEVLRDE